MADVAVIDYGAGNLESVRRAVWRAGGEAEIVSRPEDILAASRLILPGVGAAGKAIANLRSDGLDEALTEAVCQRARPLLGICLGMQLLAQRHHEFGDHECLGWIKGEVVALADIINNSLRVPHMGWNSINFDDRYSNLFGSKLGERCFYFAHSYALLQPEGTNNVVATTDYGRPIAAAVQFETVFATQFHPEKSQVDGDRLFAAFLDWVP